MPEAPSSARGALEARRSRGGRALIPFLTAGHPDWDTFDEAVRVLAGEGADLLELGIPFSDPLADGPTIQRSSHEALLSGVTVERILARVRERRAAWGIPVVLMTYANPILAYGAERFATDAVDAGVSGLLISDLPPEELPEVWSAVSGAGLERIVLVAPTTAPARIPLLAATADGYVYCVTRTGVTGEGGGFAVNLADQVEAVRRHTSVPVVAGFGIRSPEDVERIGSGIDGIVVGARWIEILSGGSRPDQISHLRALAAGLRRALDAP